MPKLTMKSKVSNAFSYLRNYGFIVITFQSKRRLTKGQRSFVDYWICGSRCMHFVESKFIDTNDRLSDEQQNLMGYIKNLSGKTIRYWLVDEDNYIEVRNEILKIG